jgi:hypothetical protein
MELDYLLHLLLSILDTLMARVAWLTSPLAPRWRPWGTLKSRRVSRGRTRGVLRVLSKPCLKFQDAGLKVLNVAPHGTEQLLGLQGKLLPDSLG